MARKKKGNEAAKCCQTSRPEGINHASYGIDAAENGFVVRVSHEKGGRNPEYISKTFIAPNRAGAMRIAAQHISGATSKLKGKKGKEKGRKKISGKA